MKSLFDNPWPAQRKLHVYALPDAALADEIVDYQQVLDGCDYCVPQPRDFLHATIQSYPITLDEVDAEGLAQLQDTLTAVASGIEPFTLRMTGPFFNARGITANAESTEDWERLIKGVRQAATDTVCAGRELGPAPFAPHVSVGYGRAEGSSESLERALDDRGRLLDRPMRVEEIHLLAVHQHPDEGIFTWEPVFCTPLG